MTSLFYQEVTFLLSSFFCPIVNCQVISLGFPFHYFLTGDGMTVDFWPRKTATKVTTHRQKSCVVVSYVCVQ
jgi:hypothetical protein